MVTPFLFGFYMSFETLHEQEIKERFLSIANELNTRFPDLDLRFNLQSESTLLRFMAAAVSPDVVELDLSDATVEDLIYAAIFQVKEIAQLYDA